MAGIDTSVFKAHSVRGAASSAAFAAGCSLKEILKTANWSSAKTFHKFYNKDIQTDNDFSFSVLARK